MTIKSSTRLFTVLALAGTMLGTALIVGAVAEDGGHGMRERDRGAASFRAGERFARADVNGDRMISLEEFQARTNERFADQDADGDGVVTPAEMVAERQQRAEERAAERIAEIDTDGDGAVSLEEMTAAGEERFARMDRNDNGSLEPRELRRAFRDVGFRDARGDRDGRGHHGRGWDRHDDGEVVERAL